MQQRAAAVVGLVDAQVVVVVAAAIGRGGDGEGRPRDLGGDAVLAARELLAVAAVAEAGARLGGRVFQRYGVAHRAAVAAIGEEDGGHLALPCLDDVVVQWCLAVMITQVCNYG